MAAYPSTWYAAFERRQHVFETELHAATLVLHTHVILLALYGATWCAAHIKLAWRTCRMFAHAWRYKVLPRMSEGRRLAMLDAGHTAPLSGHDPVLAAWESDNRISTFLSRYRMSDDDNNDVVVPPTLGPAREVVLGSRELLRRILNYVDGTHVANLARTSRVWYAALYRPEFWREALQYDFRVLTGNNPFRQRAAALHMLTKTMPVERQWPGRRRSRARQYLSARAHLVHAENVRRLRQTKHHHLNPSMELMRALWRQTRSLVTSLHLQQATWACIDLALLVCNYQTATGRDMFHTAVNVLVALCVCFSRDRNDYEIMIRPWLIVLRLSIAMPTIAWVAMHVICVCDVGYALARRGSQWVFRDAFALALTLFAIDPLYVWLGVRPPSEPSFWSTMAHVGASAFAEFHRGWSGVVDSTFREHTSIARLRIVLGSEASALFNDTMVLQSLTTTFVVPVSFVVHAAMEVGPGLRYIVRFYADTISGVFMAIPLALILGVLFAATDQWCSAIYGAYTHQYPRARFRPSLRTVFAGIVYVAAATLVPDSIWAFFEPSNWFQPSNAGALSTFWIAFQIILCYHMVKRVAILIARLRDKTVWLPALTPGQFRAEFMWSRPDLSFGVDIGACLVVLALPKLLPVNESGGLIDVVGDFSLWVYQMLCTYVVRHVWAAAAVDAALVVRARIGTRSPHQQWWEVIDRDLALRLGCAAFLSENATRFVVPSRVVAAGWFVYCACFGQARP